MVLAFFVLVATMGFVAFSIDTGHVALNKTIMQNAVDAASLAAAMEITNAIENAPPHETDPTAYARAQARIVAVDTAQANGAYVDPNLDVEFGLRWYNPATEKFEIQWGVEPSNAVKVRSRRDDNDTTQPDGKLPVLFAGVLGSSPTELYAEAIAYIEARDIAVVLDFSGSMRYDSLFFNESVNKLGPSAIEENLEQIYSELGMADGELGTLDHIDPDNPNSLRTGDAKWLTVHGPAPTNSNEAQVDVTFKFGETYVESSKLIHRIKLEFYDGATEYHHSVNAMNGTFSGTASRAGREIDKVWVTYESEPIDPTDDTTSGGLNGNCGTDATLEYNASKTSVEVTIDGNDFKAVKLYFDDGSTQTFWDWNGNQLEGTNETFSGSGSHNGKLIEATKVVTDCNESRTFTTPGLQEYETLLLEDSNTEVKRYFALDSTPYPFNNGSWDGYINYVRNDSDINRGNLREMYGGSTLAHYLLEKYPKHSQTPELARTSHFPFHAVRKGNELFVDFLDTLAFGDHVGLVSYDQRRREEEYLSEDGLTIDLTYDPLEDDYDDIKTIMEYKQASNYFSRTNIGGGIRQALQMIEDHGRQGSRPTIFLMTDGNANVHENEAGVNSLESNFVEDGYYNVPEDFDWSDIDFGDGTTFEIDDDGSYQSKARIYAISQALKAVEEGVTVHTLAVGAGADRDLMRAIAAIGDGEYISVAGDLSVDDLLDEVQAGFFRIAALVPPARLANPDEQTN